MNKNYNINKFISELYLDVCRINYVDFFKFGINYSIDTHLNIVEHLNNNTSGDKIVCLEFLWGLPLILDFNIKLFEYKFVYLNNKEIKYYSELREKLINNV